MSKLFSELPVGSLTTRNRLWMAPMCQYSADPTGPEMGRPNDWHFTHYASRGFGGVGAIIVESTAVNPVGRISPFDLCLHDDDQIPSFARLASLIASTGATPGIQLGHAGRKASGPRPWEEQSLLYPPESAEGWQPLAPSAIEFAPLYAPPVEMTGEQVEHTIEDFVSAARRAVEAGFQLIEIHGAHGYLVHQFLSPRSNQRTDKWGQDRQLFALTIIERLRGIVPVLGIRISATDWLEKDPEPSWTVDDSKILVERARDLGLDFVDVSTGGNDPYAKIPVGDEFQVPFATEIYPLGVTTSTVGRLTSPHRAEELIGTSTDIISVGRQLLSDPFLPQLWRGKLGDPVDYPEPYQRAWRRLS